MARNGSGDTAMPSDETKCAADNAGAETQGRRSIGARRNPATEKAILDAAEAILAEKGLGGFSIEAVARAARAGKPTIYRWWPNRTRLVIAVYRRQRSRALPDNADTGSVLEDALVLIDGLMTFWRNTPAGQVARSLIAEAQVDPEATEAFRAFAEERYAHAAAIFRRGIARGELRADIDPVLAAEMVIGFARGRLISGQLDISRDELVRAATQIVDGLKA